MATGVAGVGYRLKVSSPFLVLSQLFSEGNAGGGQSDIRQKCSSEDNLSAPEPGILLLAVFAHSYPSILRPGRTPEATPFRKTRAVYSRHAPNADSETSSAGHGDYLSMPLL
jgi:hypothetical protein